MASKCKMKQVFLKLLVILATYASLGCGGGSSDSGPQSTPNIQNIGRQIFFDTSLSNPKGMACASCHSLDKAFSDPRAAAVSVGADNKSKGSRNANTLTYSLFSPVFGFSAEEQDFVGGQFWDGGAKDLEEQARRPFFRSIEMNLLNSLELAERIKTASYSEDFKAAYGNDIFDDPEATLTAVVSAIAAFENSDVFHPFTSKYDYWVVNQAELSEQELRGLEAFENPQKGNCAACHPSAVGESRKNALFTDFTYDNIGLPANPALVQAIDQGLKAVTERPDDIGRFKVSSLRNVEITAPYFHNGVFNTLEEAVHFYNARDVDSSIAAPEVPGNINRDELGNLGLTKQEELDIVAFLKTLTDGFKPE